MEAATRTENDGKRLHTGEIPHVHRYAGYIRDLEKHWAYVSTNRTPKQIPQQR